MLYIPTLSSVEVSTLLANFSWGKQWIGNVRAGRGEGRRERLDGTPVWTSRPMALCQLPSCFIHYHQVAQIMQFIWRSPKYFPAQVVEKTIQASLNRSARQMQANPDARHGLLEKAEPLGPCSVTDELPASAWWLLFKLHPFNSSFLLDSF